MSQSEAYIFHQLNSSKTKQAHNFPKAVRFPKPSKQNTQSLYNIPSTSSKRTTTFGYGSKTDFTIKTSSPPPGTYQMQSQFQKSEFKNTTSIHQGRQKVTFGSFLLEALKKSKNTPSPNKYNLPSTHNTIGGRMGERIKTEVDVKQVKSKPGPAAYKLNATEIGNNGHYILSTIKNVTSPRYYSGYSLDKSKFISKQTLNPLVSYDVQQKEVGKYATSKYKNILTCSFQKSERPGLEDKSKLQNPSFKYRRFSEFGGSFV